MIYERVFEPDPRGGLSGQCIEGRRAEATRGSNPCVGRGIYRSSPRFNRGYGDFCRYPVIGR